MNLCGLKVDTTIRAMKMKKESLSVRYLHIYFYGIVADDVAAVGLPFLNLLKMNMDKHWFFLNLIMNRDCKILKT